MLKKLFCLFLFTFLFGWFPFAWGADRGPINSGETKIGLNITAPSYMDTWTFQGTQGDRAVINAVTISGSLDTKIIVYPPGGGPAEVSSFWSCAGFCHWTDQLDWQLQHTGLYTILVEDGALASSGTYNISLLEMPGAANSPGDPDGGPIASGDTLSGTINVASDMDAFQFYGAVGQRVIINAVTTSGSLDTKIIVYPPGGGPAEASSYWSCAGFCHWTDQLDWQLQQTGFYTIVVEDGGLTNSGTYNISFLAMPEAINSAADPDGGAIASGQTLVGTINVPSDMDAFQFYGNGGDRAIVSVVTTSGSLDTKIIVYPPDGGPAEASSYWSCAGFCHWTDQLDWQLQHTGLYTVVVEDGGLTNSGTYNISLTKIPSALPSGIYNPSPQNGSRLCDPTGSFSWDPMTGATGYDLYFREGPVGAATKIGNNLPTPSMAFPELEEGNVYYWGVVAHTPGGDIAGPVWWFKVPDGETGWFEGFESYSPGTFPYLGGWSLYLDGGNQSNQYVDNTHAASGSKSLHLAASSSGFAAVAYFEVGCVSKLKLEADVFIDEIASCSVHNTSAGIFLDDLTSGATFGAVRFKCDGYIYAVKDNLSNILVQLMQYSAQAWYHVTLDIDLDTMLYDVYINGVLKGLGINILNTGIPTGIILGTGASNVWFDDIDINVLPEIKADLSVTKTDAPDPVIVGNNLTYTITVTNNGPGNATGVVATDTLPGGGIAFVSATPSQGTCSGTSTVTCNLGTINASGSSTITIIVKPTQGSMTLSNTVSVSANEPDPNPANSSATSTTTVNGIRVIFPNGGETWPVGSAQTIHWTSSGVSGNVKIEISRNGGTTWSSLIASTPNDGAHPWTVTGPVTTQARIRVSSVSNPAVSDISDGNYRIGGGNVTVTSPNEGETWPIGTTQTIHWTTDWAGGNVKIEVSRNGGSTWTLISTTTPNDGSYSWKVIKPASLQARIRVSNVGDAAVKDTSDGNFRIGGGTVTVVAPNGGEVWPIGSTQRIHWSTTGFIGNVKIEVSRNGGGNWTAIASTTTNDGIYDWKVVTPLSATARIRVSSYDDPSVYDISDANFRIGGGSITVIAPNGGETWAIGTPHAIQWSTIWKGGNVKIEISRTGGDTWATLISSTLNDGVHNWTVTSPGATAARIRVSNVGDPAAADTSNGNFTIQ
jgi:uncharacterized repeat protein (TIGR01451 family)